MKRIIIPAHRRPHPWEDSKVITPLTLAALNARQLRQVCEMTCELRLGHSSAALVRSAIIGPEVGVHVKHYPDDWSDLEICEYAYAIAPLWMRQGMVELLQRFRAHVRDKSVKPAPPDVFFCDLPVVSP